MTKLRSIIAGLLVALSIIGFFVACAQQIQPSKPSKPVQATASSDAAIDYVVSMIVDYRTQSKADTHIRRYADLYVWSNTQQIVSHTLHASTRDLNTAETRIEGKSLVIVFRAQTSDLLFPHVTIGVTRSDVHVSIAESTHYIAGQYEYIVACTEY